MRSFMQPLTLFLLTKQQIRHLLLTVICCSAIGVEEIVGQSEHEVLFAARSGWETNPTRFDASLGAPVMLLDGAYQGSKLINQQKLVWRTDARKIEAIGLDLDRSDFSADVELTRTLNPWMNAWLRAEVDKVSDFERHWRFRTQWILLDRTSRTGQVGIRWALEEKSGHISIARRSCNYQQLWGYDRNEFQVEATFRRSLFKRVRGIHKLPLVNQKRSESAGLLWGQVKYDQLGFVNWLNGEGVGGLVVKSRDPRSALVFSSNDLLSPRLWLLWKAKAGYTAPEIGGWQWGASLSSEFVQDQGIRHYDHVTHTSQMWLEMKHTKWQWRAQGECGHQSFDRLRSNELSGFHSNSWWSWELRSRLGYSMNASTKALLTVQCAGFNSDDLSVSSIGPKNWTGTSIALGIQWQQTTRSKWAPSN